MLLLPFVFYHIIRSNVHSQIWGFHLGFWCSPILEANCAVFFSVILFHFYIFLVAGFLIYILGFLIFFGMCIFFSSIVVEIAILRCGIRGLVSGFDCKNDEILVFD